MGEPSYQAKVHMDQGATNLVVEVGGSILYSITDNLTAHAGGGQANATPLPAELNRVTTVTTAGDSVLLPASVGGLRIVVINAAANSMNVFPVAGDQINSLGVNAALAAAAAAAVEFFCVSAGQWQSK